MKTKLLMTAIASVVAMSATSANAQDVCTSEYQKEVVYYSFNSAQSAEVQAQLTKIIDMANTCNARSIQVVCHTDTTGPASYNQALSESRAADVLNVLVGRGVSRNIISSSGMGETSLMVPTGDGVKEQLNRRCEIDLQLDPATIGYTETYTTTTQPSTQTVTETVTELVSVPGEPIGTTEVTVMQPSVGQPITTTVPGGTVGTPSVGAPSVGAPVGGPVVGSPPPLPPVSTGGGILGGLSTPVVVGGLAAVVAAGILIADGDDDDDDAPAPASP